MSALETAKKRVNDLNSQIREREIALRGAKHDLRVLEAKALGIAIGDIIRSTGYSHKGKTAKIIGFSEGWKNPHPIVTLQRKDGTFGEAQYEFIDWEKA